MIWTIAVFIIGAFLCVVSLASLIVVGIFIEVAVEKQIPMRKRCLAVNTWIIITIIGVSLFVCGLQNSTCKNCGYSSFGKYCEYCGANMKKDYDDTHCPNCGKCNCFK